MEVQTGRIEVATEVAEPRSPSSEIVTVPVADFKASPPMRNGIVTALASNPPLPPNYKAPPPGIDLADAGAGTTTQASSQEALPSEAAARCAEDTAKWAAEAAACARKASNAAGVAAEAA